MNNYLRFRSFLPLFFALVLSFFLLRPILPQEVWYPVHDTTQLIRLSELETTLKAGQIPAVWAYHLNRGYGYPLFHFYAPLFSYFALGLKTVVGSYFTALKLTLFLSLVLGTTGIYHLVKRWGRASAFLAGAVYSTLPYLALNLYVRGAYAELLAVSLLPWVFYLWQDLSTPRRQVMAALATAAFILSHNLIPLITFPFFLAWIFIVVRPSWRQFLLVSAFTFGLAAWFIFPLFFERSFVQVDSVAKTTDYSLHFVMPWQLWNSTWGFGGSAPGVEDGISFKLGKLAVLLSLSSLLLFFRRFPRRFLVFFMFSLLTSLYLATGFSAWIWRSLNTLQLVQFPWRFLALAGFFLSVLAGLSLSLINSKFFKTLFLLVILLSLFHFNLKYFAPQTTFPADLARYQQPAYLNTVAKIIPEYLPVWMSSFPASSSPVTLTPNFQSRFKTNFNSAQTLTHALAYYPTWSASLDGQPLPLRPSSSGLLEFDIPAGPHQIILAQSHTRLERLSTLLSLFTVLSLLIYFFFPRHVQI